MKDIKKLSKLLIKNNIPYNIDILEQYQIDEDDIHTGVFCPKCQTLSMVWKRGSWLCNSCNITSKDAHLTALKDYSLLIGSTITNHQIRRFLHISSDTTAKKLLKSMKFPYSGVNKAREYYFPKP
ncbi:hypothetical protein IMZ08_04740 [Bacillus luteolus]|uniref:Transposase n=1 Tax=Litchfieldia luteola TaxID=682179 RepID=A0ABR9QFV8_9BACI|nr:hypothetical protein [Cytobacillus luteolus]MBE4907368.1 hypothetical protein [Cytobacillus luteolus]MBP1944133.1 ribosomal protein L37AE/L43A [Cytobacillus luteolus]